MEDNSKEFQGETVLSEIEALAAQHSLHHMICCLPHFAPAARSGHCESDASLRLAYIPAILMDGDRGEWFCPRDARCAD
jgi:hypothetical protein